MLLSSGIRFGIAVLAIEILDRTFITLTVAYVLLLK